MIFRGARKTLRSFYRLGLWRPFHDVLIALAKLFKFLFHDVLVAVLMALANLLKFLFDPVLIALAKLHDFLGSKIRRLTPEQEARLPEFRERWRRIFRATAPIDRAAARAAIGEVYRLAGRKPPETVIFLESPLAGAVGAAMLSGGGILAWDWPDDGVWDEHWPVDFWDEDWPDGEARDDRGDEAWLKIRGGVRDRVRERIIAQAAAPGTIQAEGQVEFWEPVWGAVRAKVHSQVRAKVRSQLYFDLERCVTKPGLYPPAVHVWRQLADWFEQNVGSPSPTGHGHQDAGWLSACDFLHKVCGLKGCAPLEGAFLLAENCGRWWGFENAAILTERPCLSNRDEDGRPHCEDGPALKYPDGWSVWAWHGVRVPQDVIERPERLTEQRIESEWDIEVRRAMTDRTGLKT